MSSDSPWQLLFVDDDEEFHIQVEEFFTSLNIESDRCGFRVTSIADFNEALTELAARRIDVLVLDVRLGSVDSDPEEVEAGVKALSDVRARRFVPIVFYTAVPHKVRAFESPPLIQVVEKTAGLDQLAMAVRTCLQARLPFTTRALQRHIDDVQRDYMWNFVAPQWSTVFERADSKTELAYLIVRRFAMSLTRERIQELVGALTAGAGEAPTGDLVHPMEYWIIPPLENENTGPTTGDLYKSRSEPHDYWILLTPSCDLVPGREKAERIALAKCHSLLDEEEFKRWEKSGFCNSGNEIERMKSLLRNNRQGKQPERFYFLPGALDVPSLIADFQMISTDDRGVLNSLDRVAMLDAPFREALLARFSRYFARLGTPDLDIDVVLSQIRDLRQDS